MLKDRDAAKEDSEGAYLEAREIVSYLDGLGMSPSAIHKHLAKLLDHRCVEPYDPTVNELGDETRLKITASGLIHIEFAVSDHTYLEHIGLSTEVRENTEIDAIRQIFASHGLGQQGWQQAVHLFAKYCISQDLIFYSIPQSHGGQFELRNEFCRRWGVAA